MKDNFTSLIQNAQGIEPDWDVDCNLTYNGL